ncbi:hypothetical protein [Bacillus xiapuensis]|uniref:Uncharacterized protein n=1 Tax=Bacillus xiapuensis TaxID=2014075 RepID=A0ABU6NA68_9BACI|nr:hypothetical protein [Bacillus xiapuensis]
MEGERRQGVKPSMYYGFQFPIYGNIKQFFNTDELVKFLDDHFQDKNN